MIHRKLGIKHPTYCTLYISRMQSYNFFMIFTIVVKCFLFFLQSFFKFVSSNTLYFLF